VIGWQESLGLRSITDGEFRRESWRLGFVSKVAGFGRADSVGDVDLQRDDAGNEARIGAAPIALQKGAAHRPDRRRRSRVLAQACAQRNDEGDASGAFLSSLPERRRVRRSEGVPGSRRNSSPTSSRSTSTS
jgi:hypothetical protein